MSKGHRLSGAGLPSVSNVKHRVGFRYVVHEGVCGGISMKLMLVHSHRSDQVRSDQLTTLFGSCFDFSRQKKFSSFFSKLEREKKKKKKREREREQERESGKR